MALTAVGIGAGLTGISLAVLAAPLLVVATGAAGMVLGGGYLMSPAWRLVLVIDDQGYEVRTRKATKFRVAWSQVTRVVASPTTSSCYVDAGTPERSLLVPGDGAPAPYDLEDRPAIVAAILAHVPADKVKTVETLEQARKLGPQAQ